MPKSDEEFLLDLTRSLSEQAATLRAAAMLDYKVAADSRDDPVREALRRCGELARASADLGNSKNPAALALVARAVLENLISLLWIVISEDNAMEHERAAVAELARAARVNFVKGNARVMNRKTGKDETKDFLKRDQFKSLPRRRSVEEQATTAGVLHLYDVFYRFFSVETHGHGSVGESDETTLQATLVNLQGIGALCLASGHAGVLWLLHRQRVDNETLRQLLGFARDA